MAQPQYNWLERDLESGYLPVCQRAGIAITPYRPLAGGLLSGKYQRGTALPAGSRAAESAWIDEDDIPYEELHPFHEEAAAAGRLAGVLRGPLAPRPGGGGLGGGRGQVAGAARGAGRLPAGSRGLSAGVAQSPCA